MFTSKCNINVCTNELKYIGYLTSSIENVYMNPKYDNMEDTKYVHILYNNV